MTAPDVARTATAYPRALLNLGRARIDVLGAALRLMLVGGGYTPATGDEYVDRVSLFEAAGPGYVAGGPLLSGRMWELDESGRAVLRADPVVFTAAGFLAHYAVVYADVGDPAASPLISRIDFGADLDPQGEDLRLTFPDGVFRLGPPA